MRTSRIIILASAIAITALLITAAAIFPNYNSGQTPSYTNDAATPANVTAPEITTLEPVVVVATR